MVRRLALQLLELPGRRVCLRAQYGRRVATEGRQLRQQRLERLVVEPKTTGLCVFERTSTGLLRVAQGGDLFLERPKLGLLRPDGGLELARLGGRSVQRI